jgi:hypothetical protein
VITKLPDWVVNPPQDTQTTFYGTGNGYNLESSTSAALKDVTGKLGVTVSSIYKQREQITNSQYQKYIDDQVNLSVEATPISKYQVIKNEVINGQVYSLLKVEKPQLLTSIQDKLVQENSKATKVIKQKAQTSNLIWWLRANVFFEKSSQTAYRYASIVNLLDPSIKIDQNLTPWVTLLAKIEKSEEILCISFVDKDKHSSDFIKVFKNSLSGQKINITSQCKDKLIVSSTEQNTILYQKYVSSNELKLELIRGRNTAVANHSIILTGQSVSNYGNARKGAVSQLTHQLKSKNLWQQLEILK